MSKNGVPTRLLGKTNEDVSILGLGGYHIGKLEKDKSIKLIRRAIDEGITFMDNAWCYHNGQSEKLMGEALKDGYREKVFLMTKNHGRTKELFKKQLDESLKRLNTDYIDLLQLHEIINFGVPEKIKNEGVLDAVLEAKKKGKIRFIGFTGHRYPSLHQEMLDLDFDWDTVQMPLNVLDYHYRSFQNQILPQAKEKNMGIIGMKSLAAGRIFKTDISVEEAIRYSLSLPISTLVSGIDSFEVLEQNLKIIREFKEMDEKELDEFRNKFKKDSFKGQYEYYKND
ncbi:MAG: aldo/keto reductase [Halanaerobiales bacterium]|nr:aldo/keto reductase [Halanaerobiales bacterium]